MAVVRTRFGFTNAMLTSRWYDGDVIERTKAEMLERHRREVAATGETVVRGPLCIDQSVPYYDGLEFEWVSELEAPAHADH